MCMMSGVMRLEKILERSLLYDFYGELLTEHQRSMYEAVVLNDTGYSEAAQEAGISRQGVHDMIRRCDRQMEAYEEKLGLMEKFLRIRELVREIDSLAAVLQTELAGQKPGKTGIDPERIRSLCRDIREEL